MPLKHFVYQLRRWAGGSVPVREKHEGWIHDLAVTPDGARVLTVDGGGCLGIWDARALGLEKRVRLDRHGTRRGGARALAMSPDGASIFVARSPGALCRHRLADLSVEWEAPFVVGPPTSHGILPTVSDLAASPDGRYVVSFAPEGPDETKLRVWDARTGAAVARLAGHAPFAFVGDSALCFGTGSALRVVACSDGRELESRELPAGFLAAMATSASRERVAALASRSWVLHEWNRATGAVRGPLGLLPAGFPHGALGRAHAFVPTASDALLVAGILAVRRVRFDGEAPGVGASAPFDATWRVAFRDDGATIYGVKLHSDVLCKLTWPEGAAPVLASAQLR